jgi:hypothetical protein
MRANGCTRYIQNFPVFVGFMRLSANLRKWPNVQNVFRSKTLEVPSAFPDRLRATA